MDRGGGRLGQPGRVPRRVHRTDGPTGGTGEQLTGAELLAGSDNLPSYLLSHFVIEQDGRPCEGQVTQLQDLLTLGAQLGYTCPQPVDSVELTVTTLTDINENYRTVVTSDVSVGS